MGKAKKSIIYDNIRKVRISSVACTRETAAPVTVQKLNGIIVSLKKRRILMDFGLILKSASFFHVVLAYFFSSFFLGT